GIVVRGDTNLAVPARYLESLGLHSWQRANLDLRSAGRDARRWWRKQLDNRTAYRSASAPGRGIQAQGRFSEKADPCRPDRDGRVGRAWTGFPQMARKWAIAQTIKSQTRPSPRAARPTLKSEPVSWWCAMIRELGVLVRS